MSDTASIGADVTSNGPGLEPYVRDALRGSGMKVADLTEDQHARAHSAPSEKAGLRGKALAAWILENVDTPVTEKKRKRAKKNKDAKKPRSRSKGYPEWVPSAVARAKELSAQKGFDEGVHVPSAGPVQHVKVRKVFTDELEGDVTPARILELTGISSKKAMKDIATFKADRAALKTLRPFGAKFDKDGWAKGRFLAAILYVWIEDLESEV